MHGVGPELVLFLGREGSCIVKVAPSTVFQGSVHNSGAVFFSLYCPSSLAPEKSSATPALSPWVSSVVSSSWAWVAIYQVTCRPPRAEALRVLMGVRGAVTSTYCVLSSIRNGLCPQCHCQRFDCEEGRGHGEGNKQEEQDLRF